MPRRHDDSNDIRHLPPTGGRRALAPVKTNMRAVVEGIETMRHEESAYWAGMAIHRRHSRRMLMALRILLTDGAAH